MKEQKAGSRGFEAQLFTGVNNFHKELWSRNVKIRFTAYFCSTAFCASGSYRKKPYGNPSWGIMF